MVVIFIFAVGAPIPAAAGGLAEVVVGREAGSPSIAFGLSTMGLSSDLVHAPGPRSGYEITIGYRLHGPRSLRWSRLSLEFDIAAVSGDVGVRAAPEHGWPASAASFSVLTLGARVDLFEPARSRWTPWAGVGAGLANLSALDSGSGYAETALVPVFSAGADLGLRAGLALRARIATVRSGAMGGLSYTAGTLGLAWEFLRPPHHRRPGWSEPLPPPAPPAAGPPAEAPREDPELR